MSPLPPPLNSCVQPCREGTGNAPYHANYSLSGPSQGRQGAIPAVCLSHPLILLSLLTSSSSGIEQRSSSMWVHPHRAAHSCHPYWHQSWTQLQLAPGWQRVPTGALTVVFCLVDTAAPWWSCLDFSVLHAPLLRQLLPKLPRHVLLAAPTCLSTLLAMLLVTSTPQGLLLHVWGPGHHCSWPCQVLTADVRCGLLASLWVPHEVLPVWKLSGYHTGVLCCRTSWHQSHSPQQPGPRTEAADPVPFKKVHLLKSLLSEMGFSS